MVRHMESVGGGLDAQGALAEGVWEYVDHLLKNSNYCHDYRQMASLPLSRRSSCSSSDNESSESDSKMLASLSLQEIRQEDLAAILPDQQECDAFGAFDCRPDKNSPQTGEGSGSDMELPQQAVKALLQRTTDSSSDSESPTPFNPPHTLYANSLLQQFVAQTQMLNAPSSMSSSADVGGAGVGVAAAGAGVASGVDQQSDNVDSTDVSKRRRGRPVKYNQNQKGKKCGAISKVENLDFINPNVSPDSGIQNSSDHVSSPEPSPYNNGAMRKNKIEKRSTRNSSKTVQKKPQKTTTTMTMKEVQQKMPVTSNSFDRVLYGNTDRVLYPPRRKATGRIPVARKYPPRPNRQKQEVKLPDKINLTGGGGGGGNKKKVFNEKLTCDNNRSNNVNNNTGRNLLKNDKPNENNKKQPGKRRIKGKGGGGGGGGGAIKKMTNVKVKNEVRYATFKNLKLMHSRHKHKKHKKCKFRILKPLNSTDQRDNKLIDQEVDKLVLDFLKLCSISNQKSQKEHLPEILKTIKKSNKKRKMSEFNDRKKKKINVSSSTDKEKTPNEQRLPLKKRHYHLSTNNENSRDSTKIEKSKNTKNSTVSSSLSVKNEPEIEGNNLIPSPEKVLSSNSDNNASKSLKICSHIDEAIEATINRYSNNNNNISNDRKSANVPVTPVKAEKSDCLVNTTTTTTTPKKRHWHEVKNNNVSEVIKSDDESSVSGKNLKGDKQSLENVVLELKINKKITDTVTKKVPREEIAQMMTRKKNRLEDLTSNLASKINTNVTTLTFKDGNSVSNSDVNQKKRSKDVTINKRSEEVTAADVVTKKVKPAAEIETLDSITAETPTGIFMPTVDLELHIPATTIETNKENLVLKRESVEEILPLKQTAHVPSLIRSPEKNETIVKKKIRKRRAINRTGFPTVKKKKKKPLVNSSTATAAQNDETNNEICDRVPLEGEKYSAFVQRTEKVIVSDVLLEKLQKSNVTSDTNNKNPPNGAAAEVATILINIKQERPSSRLSIKQEKRDKSVSSETSDSNSVLPSSKRIKTDPNSEDVDLEDLSLEERLEMSKATRRPGRTVESKRQQEGTSSKFMIHKRRLRDVSSSSSEESKKNSRKAPRWRKKYLVAGLFSDYYKENDEIVRQRRAEAANKPTKLVYKPEEHRYGLLPPPYHCGKFLRCRKLPFKLPYDLWWQHVHNQLPGRDIVPSWNYRKIRTNVYNVKSTTMSACEAQTCNCTSSSGCGDDCINRLVYVECPATHKCRNQKIQRHEWAPGIEKYMTDDKGWGVRTNMPIKSGEFILEYVGEVVSDQEFKERMASRYAHDTHHYCLHLDGGLVIDGHRMGGEGRFVNHSCEPNCEMQKWSVNGQFRMALFALRDINAGEELTYDYNFSLFNPADGQVCKCCSENCRGVIGGKSQRVRQQLQQQQGSTGRVGRPRKNRAKRSTSPPKETLLLDSNVDSNCCNLSLNGNSNSLISMVPLIPFLKPLTSIQKTYVREHHCFLPRNLMRVRKLRDRSSSNASNSTRARAATPTGNNQTPNGSNGNGTNNVNNSATFLDHINAIRQPRNIKTRRLAQAEDDPDFNKTAKLAGVLKDLCTVVSSSKDEKDELLCLPFVTLPSRRKLSEYYSRIPEPIDLTTIEQNVSNGVYKNVESFDYDMMRLFNNAVKFFGRTSETGIAATRLKKAYQEAKEEHVAKIEEVLGEKVPQKFITKKNKGDEEDVIRCICGMYRDEGLMIQCERCLVWQHCECIKADPNAPSYHCERCTPRNVDYEIPLDEYTEHGHRFYMTLLRDELQLRQGDTVYVLRDIPIPGTDKKHNYKTIGEIEYTELDIFRIERLWKDSETGQRYAYGHHYLRPHETFHEPTRKFFPNEVMRVPLYEAVPVELIIRHCWVMDVNTFCKGRPIGAPESHIYICEYRVDKSARLFSKISKSKFPICTKSYAFERFDTRLKITRTYTPHDLEPGLLKGRGRKMTTEHQDLQKNNNQQVNNKIGEVATAQKLIVSNSNDGTVAVVKTRSYQKARLNKILLNLLSKMSSKQVLDVSYLLEGGRRRKKQT